MLKMRWLLEQLGKTISAGLLGGVLPLLVLHLVLRHLRFEASGLAWTPWLALDLVKSDILFHMGMALVLVGAVASWENLAGRQSRFARPLGWVGGLVGGLAFAAVVLAEIISHRFYLATGSTLDHFLLAFTMEQFAETWQVISSEIPAHMWFILVASGPGMFVGLRLAWLALERWGPFVGQSRVPNALTGPQRMTCLVLAGMFILAAGLDPLVASSASFARNSTVNLVMSWWHDFGDQEVAISPRTALLGASIARQAPPQNPKIPRNLVVILLESTRARSTSLHDPMLTTTPFLKELAQTSLVAERAYTVVPHTSKALVATLCGYEPQLTMPINESAPNGLPGPCLARLLGSQGFATAFFQSATEAFEGRRQLVTNMGYETFVPNEQMPSNGFVRANYFGFEDDIMLGPSRGWLEENRNKPLFATYLTLTPHHDYLAPRRYGRHPFAEDDELNRYLNTVHYVDRFVANLVDQYKALGLYEDTVFVVVGDHGEGFGEHGRRQHDNVIYEEGVHIPLLVHVPGRFPEGARVTTPVSQIDVMPTVLDFLGFEPQGATYPGLHLQKSPPDRVVFAHCWYERRCMAAIGATHKYIHHFHREPDEFFDLAKDPMERHNLALDPSELGRWLTPLKAWRAEVLGLYEEHNGKRLERAVLDRMPRVAHPVDVRLGEHVRLVGYDVSHKTVEPGQSLRVTYYFEALKPVPPDWKLFVHGVGTGRMINLDHVPVSGLYPLQDWKPGQFIVDEQVVLVPARWRPGHFEILLGVYHADKGRAEPKGNLPVDDQRRVRLVRLPVVAPSPPSGPPKAPGAVPEPPRQQDNPQGQENQAPVLP